MAPTRPSIMSDGAMMSAPASASETDCLARFSSVASLSTSWPCEHAAVAVVGVLAEADVDDLHQARHLGASSARRARWTMPSGDQAALPTASLLSGRPKRSTVRIPSAKASRAVSTRSKARTDASRQHGGKLRG